MEGNYESMERLSRLISSEVCYIKSNKSSLWRLLGLNKDFDYKLKKVTLHGSFIEIEYDIPRHGPQINWMYKVINQISYDDYIEWKDWVGYENKKKIKRIK